ncbi:OmpA family protein [Roseospira marina]|uniref:OmpA family protein n=1 Tax=Roseospira marina TaxID=140057 RepID=A0A5M6IG37_9PROT|nr:OmpA family protein [Roseospira marina]
MTEPPPEPAPAPPPEPLASDTPEPAEPVSAPPSAPAGPPVPFTVTMAKPEPPARPARRDGAAPTRTRLSVGTTRLTSDAQGRVGPAPPPLAVPGTAMRQPPAAVRPAPAPAPAESPAPPAPPETQSRSNDAPASGPAPLALTPPADSAPADSGPSSEGTTVPPAASAADGQAPSVGGTVSVPFDTDRTELPDAARAALDGVVAALDGNPRARATVRAYADGGGDANQARRTSLSRALSVRAYLIDRGVASARIDVRALGNQAGEGRKDRVDIVTSDR